VKRRWTGAVLIAAVTLSPGVALSHMADPEELPLGNLYLSDVPEVGHIWPCRIDPAAGGAMRTGAWVDETDGTFDVTAKPHVEGAVMWDSRFTITLRGEERIIATNDLPDHPTGVFPMQADDPAAFYDRNPNAIREQDMTLCLPADPVPAAEASCAPGAVGVLLSGSVLFNALDALGRDALAYEIQDRCDGHPQQAGVYHYHHASACVLDDHDGGNGHSALIGYAIDGFGLFGPRGEAGVTLSSGDLDACHGHVHEVDWDGRQADMYHYHATLDFPYTIGCLRGAYDRRAAMVLAGGAPGQADGQTGGQQPPGGPPDLAAAAAELGIGEHRLRQALGPPPPDLEAASHELGIPVEDLRRALGAP